MLFGILLLSLSACGGATGDPGSASDGASENSATGGVTNTDSREETRSDPQDILEDTPHLVGLCEQIHGRITVCDLAVEDWSKDRAVVWEYEPEGNNHIAGIKFRDCPYYGGKVVLYCYPGGAEIVSYESKKLLFRTTDIGWNPHSVELLPDGTFIVASSSDNLVCVFAPGEKYACQKLEFPDAHGVLYDPSLKAVWLVGMNQLSAYSVTVTGKPQLELIDGMAYTSPQSGMHDLAPLYGEPSALLVTCNAGIMKFDKDEESFSYSYSGGKVGKGATYAPGVGNFEDGVLAYTSIVSDKTVYQDWCTNEVRVYIPLSEVRGTTVVRKAPDDAYYKLRVLNFNYQ